MAQLVKICLQRGRPGFDPWVGKIPWRRERLPTPIFWPGEFCGLSSFMDPNSMGSQIGTLKGPMNPNRIKKQKQKTSCTQHTKTAQHQK